MLIVEKALLIFDAKSFNEAIGYYWHLIVLKWIKLGYLGGVR